MGSYINFKNFGETPMMSNDGGKQPENFPMARQSSIYNLTFGELQNTFSGLGKDLGSMNMDELLKNLWNVEENQGMTSGAAVGGEGTGIAPIPPIGNLQKQGSLTLPRTLSQKTVDEVWRNLLKETTGVNDVGSNGGGGGGGGGSGVPPDLQQRQQTVGEMTLEEFLVRAGVVREDAQPVARQSDGGFYGELLPPNNNTGLDIGFQHPIHNTAGIMVNNRMTTENNIPMSNQPPSLALNIGGLRSYQQLPPLPLQQAPPPQQQQQQPKPLFPKQANVAFASPMNLVHSSQLTSPGTRGSTIIAMSDPSTNNGLGQVNGLKNREMGTVGLGTGLSKVAAGSPVNHQLSPDVIGKSSTPSLSPASYIYNPGTRGRKSSGGFEKVVERRHRRMIKNRESAARSRARKQAYTLELEAEIALLKERNEELQKKQAEIVELQNNQIIERMKLPWGGKRVCLRRTLTGPW